jgi:hypothetical protein
MNKQQPIGREPNTSSSESTFRTAMSNSLIDLWRGDKLTGIPRTLSFIPTAPFCQANAAVRILQI